MAGAHPQHPEITVISNEVSNDEEMGQDTVRRRRRKGGGECNRRRGWDDLEEVARRTALLKSLNTGCWVWLAMV